MKAHELAASIQRNGVAPVYLVVGEEDYLRDQSLTVIKRAALGEQSLEEFNCDQFYGDECAGTDILNCARELPAFAARRVVLVKATDKLTARETEVLIPYLKDPNATTTVVFSSAKLDGRLKFSQALKDKAVVVECGPLPVGQAPAWVRAQAGQLGVQLNEDATHLLADLAGESLYLVTRELEKLAAFVPQGTVADVAQVDMLRGTEPGASVFDLSAAIAAGDRSRTLTILARNLESGEAPLRIFGSLVWQYRRLWKARALLASGRADSEVGRTLGIPPFRLGVFLDQVRDFSEDRLREAFQLFLETDSALKGGRATAPERILEMLLLRLSLEPKRTAPPVEQTAEPAAPESAPRSVRRTKPIRNVRTIRSLRKPSS